MGSLPVAVNKNLNQAGPLQEPIAGTSGKTGALGAIKADGTTIQVDQATGIASVVPGGGGVEGTGTPGFLPKWDTTTSIEDSLVDEGVTLAGQLTVSENQLITEHAAIGPNATVDGVPPGNNVFVPDAVLNLSESSVDPDGLEILYLEWDWAPNADVSDANSYALMGGQFSVNMDGQTTDDCSVFGSLIELDINSDTIGCDAIGLDIDVNVNGNTDSSGIYGGVFSANQNGTGSNPDLVGCFSNCSVAAGTTGEASAYVAQVPVSGGTIDGFTAGFWYDGGVSSITGGTVAECDGFRYHSVAVSGGATVTLMCGIHLSPVTGGVTNYAILSDGAELSLFAGPIKVPYTTAQQVYSVAGTALPVAATAGEGARAFVSDATLNTFGSAYVGGGVNKVPVWTDGTTWYIG